MKKKVSKRHGAYLISIGLILIVGAAALTAYNLWDNYRAESNVEKTIQQLDNARFEYTLKENDDKSDPFPEEEPDPNRDMPTVTVNGYKYIGTLTIPPLEVELPVTEEWDYERMRIAVCRYTGTVYLDNMVICAHNYSNVFGRLKNLQKGDQVIFTDVENNTYRYRVIETEVLQPTAVEKMITGDWDLTLFTCNYWGDARVTIRCERY